MSAMQKPLREGLVVGDRYQIDAPWGIDETGFVYRCRDLETGKARTKMKILSTDSFSSGSAGSLFKYFSLLRRLRHPNLIRILDFGILEDSGRLFQIEEWIDGEDLLSATEGADPERILNLIIDASKAVQYLHARGIVHGNINRANAILSKPGESRSLKLLGFGLMQVLPQHLRNGGFGALNYVAPEVLMGGAVNESSDLYSLGVLMYQLLARRLPFEDEDPGFLIQKHLQGSVDLRTIERLKCGAGLTQLLCALLDKDPSKRPACGEVVMRISGELPDRKCRRAEVDSLESYLSASPLVGREQEMQLLQKSAMRVRMNGRGRTVFITGEAGSGKSRCLEELKLWALLEGWRVIEGTCGMQDEGAYGPFRQILAKTEPVNGKPIFQFDDVPRLAESASFEASSDFAAGQFRDLLTRELVRRLTKRHTVLLLHNFHLSDEATNTVLDYLSSDIQTHPVLMCVSLRSSEETKGMLGRVIEQTIRQNRGQVLSLPPLTQEDVGQLVVGITGDDELKRTLGTWMFKSIGGNPFFLEEMLKHLVEQGLLYRELEKWRFMDQELPNMEVPASVGALLQLRFVGLAASARDLANWLALLNRPVSKKLLRSISRQDPGLFEESLEDLRNRQMIRIEVEGVEENAEFCHSLIAEVIRGDLPDRLRRRMHRRIAEVLERECGVEGHQQELALHYMESRQYAKAIEHALGAAAECKREYSDEGALRFYEYILGKNHLLEPNILHEIAILAAESCCALGIPKRATELLSRQFRRSGSMRSQARARLLLNMAIAYRHIGDAPKVELYAKRALVLLNRKREPDSQSIGAACLTHLAYCRFLKSQPRIGLKLLMNALNMISGNRNATAGQIYSFISALQRVSCDLVSAVKAGRESIGILEPLQNYHMLAVAHSHLGACLVALGRFTKALEQHKKAVDISEKTRSLPLRSQALSNLAECLCRQGRLIEARLASEKAVNLSIECGNPTIKHSSLAILGEIQLNAGEYGRACRILSDLDNDKNPFLAIFSKAHVSYLLARLYFEIGDFEKAITHIDKLHKLENDEALVYERELADAISARILFHRGGRSDAIDLLRDLTKAVQNKHWPYQTCLIMLDLGECLIREENFLEARIAINNALRLARGMDCSLLLANARLSMGRLLKARAPDDCDFLVNNAKPQIESVVALSKHFGEIEVVWRAHSELSKLEEALSNWNACLFHNSEAIRILNSLRSQELGANQGSFWATFDRNQVILQSEQRKNLIPKHRKALAIEEIYDHQIQTLSRVSSIIGSIHDLNPLLTAIADQLINAIGLERVLVYLKDELTGRLEFFTGRSIKENSIGKEPIIGHDLLDEVSRTGQPLVSADTKGDPRYFLRSSPIGSNSGTILCAPLKASGRVLGVLYADDLLPAGSLSESVINLFAAFCSLAGVAIDNALAHQGRILDRSEMERFSLQDRDEYKEIIGKGEAIVVLRDRIALASASPLDILITGESGTGKELVASAIHRTGRRKSAKFIPIDCGALSDNLAEAELFGYRKGAFTGAAENRQGLLEAAQGGIIFLDEISNLPFRLQAKLLRVLQEREVRRIGETSPRRIDIQIIAATNRDLLVEIKKGRFRHDLYYRLRLMEVRVPPLRDHAEDIPLLIEWFLEGIAQSEGGRSKIFSQRAKEVLCTYHYPGNVRELKNIVSEAYYSAKMRIMDMDILRIDVRKSDFVDNSSYSKAAGYIFAEIVEGRGNFENLVKEPFTHHKFGIPVLRGVIELALKETHGKYRDAFSLLRIPDRRYSIIMQFLKRNKCYVDFRPFRRVRI
jgi:transcriptional regulator with GAF, ATPase, and Fis domain/serine/threonine protein kinase/tetratricopeptide (TPR) repeat protein